MPMGVPGAIFEGYLRKTGIVRDMEQKLCRKEGEKAGRRRAKG